MNQYSGHTFNKFLRKFSPKNPVVFTFHLNWKVYENIHLDQFKHVQQYFKMNNIHNIELLPILTDKKTYIDNRMKQFKNGLERIVDKYERKAHIIGYSFAGILPRGYISLYNGDDYIESVLTIGTPNKGSTFADMLMGRNFEDKWYQIEPAIRAMGVHKEWLINEYSTKTMYDTNNIFVPSPNVKYSSVGGRRTKLRCSESLRMISEEMTGYNAEEPSDGVIAVKDNEYGKHLMNFDADHFELIGMRANYKPSLLFEFYSNTVKNSDSDLIDFMQKQESYSNKDIHNNKTIIQKS